MAYNGYSECSVKGCTKTRVKNVNSRNAVVFQLVAAVSLLVSLLGLKDTAESRSRGGIPGSRESGCPGFRFESLNH